MPRENRKRGKKHKKKPGEFEQKSAENLSRVEEEQNAGPSWMIPAKDQPSLESSLEAPFGYVDADVKAYFKTVDVQIRAWQDGGSNSVEEDQDRDPNEEERQLFFLAALTEMSGKEKQLATDPECSTILERMLHSMDDFVRRVFVDSLVGSYEALVRHRFASHVCQTLFEVASNTISRECRGILPSVPESSDRGELRTMTQLVLDICEEFYSSFTAIVMDPFASHVMRALLLLLSPSINLPNKANTFIRSKKSALWKARQGPMKSLFSEENTSGTIATTPDGFAEAAQTFIRIIKDGMDANEVRALAANKVASPMLQVLLEVESDRGLSNIPDSLMDRVLVGIITSYHENPTAKPESSDYLSTLLRDPTSSHLLETMIVRAPEEVVPILWEIYFHGKLGRLSMHPVANFVVAKAIEKTTPEQLSEACEELDAFGTKLINSARTGVLRALTDRAVALQKHEDNVIKVFCNAFGLKTPEDRLLLVPCALMLKPLEEYKSTLSRQSDARNSQSPAKTKNSQSDADEPKTQGAVLLQSMLRLAEPHNQIAVDSISSLPMDQLLSLAYNTTSSRVLDTVLESPHVTFKAKRTFVMSLIGHYHLLVDDRIGSRVGDRCWAFADPYLKEKIARSLIPHEQLLVGSYYGKFFARNLNLYLLQRRPAEWKELQASRKAAAQPAATTEKVETKAASSKNGTGKRKRSEHEIDSLFDSALGKKLKKGALVADTTEDQTGVRPVVRDLEDVLGAIRTAPKSEEKRRKKNR